MTLEDRYSKLPLGNICDANGKVGAMDYEIKPVDPKCVMAGPAFTVKGYPGDNLAIHLAIAEAPKGSVLVVDVCDYSKGGHFGEIMATACQAKGIAGLVINGSIRDAADIERLGFPVFARCSCPNGTVKETVGELNVPIVVGGVLVNPGDMIIGNRDGVAVVSKEKALTVLSKAEAMAAKEDAIIPQLKAGKTTLEIYKFPKALLS